MQEFIRLENSSSKEGYWSKIKGRVDSETSWEWVKDEKAVLVVKKDENQFEFKLKPTHILSLISIISPLSQITQKIRLLTIIHPEDLPSPINPTHFAIKPIHNSVAISH